MRNFSHHQLKGIFITNNFVDQNFLSCFFFTYYEGKKSIHKNARPNLIYYCFFFVFFVKKSLISLTQNQEQYLFLTLW